MSENNFLIPAVSGNSTEITVVGIEKLATHFLQSGYFKDLRNMSQAVVKILKGKELGIGPFTAVDQINMIQGKPSPNANLIASLIRKSKDYDYDVIELTNVSCKIQILRNEKPCGPPVEFTYEDAKKAGLTRNPTYNAYPKNMLFARCISNAAKFHCPDVTMGLYVPEDFNEDSNDYENESNRSPLVEYKIEESPAQRPAANTAQELMAQTNTTLEELNTALGTSFETPESVNSTPFVISYLRSKKEAQG